MKGQYPPTPLKKYPHLIGGDIAIWDRFVRGPLNTFDSFDYDVRVGVGQPMPVGLDPSIAEMGKTLTQRRIDVIGWKDIFATIIEVKQYAGVSAIGQAQCYAVLWAQTFGRAMMPEVMIVTDQINNDTENLCHHFNIAYIIV
ncbi:MAG: hypothetical protein OEM02_12320 [Desulfobulbaceae bacterium]|nr:hypothetical protein [Desulfobulbaceae bacterium]